LRSAIIRLISVFGRYSVLILIPPITLMMLGWLHLFDSSSIIAIVLAIPATIIALASVVLILGILLSGIPRPQGLTVSREDAPHYTTQGG